METPLLSIITITYNHEPYIRKTIEGVLMQMVHFPYEYIIAEDCSSDNTREICLEYVKKYPDKIRLITSDSNVGAVENERRAMQAAKGKYIAYCEGDDYWTDPNKLQKQVDFLEKNPSYSVCFHRCLHFNVATSEFSDDLCKSLLKDNKCGVEVSLDDFFAEWITQPLTMVYRRNAFDLDLIDHYVYYRDMHLIYHLMRNGRCYLFAFVGGVRIIHSDGMFSCANTEKKCSVGVEIAKELYLLNKDDSTKLYYENMLQWYLYNVNSTKKVYYSFQLYKLNHNVKRFLRNLIR